MYGYIYKTTNLANNKIYIGQHKASVFEPSKYIGSGVILDYAIKKYGPENFKNELLCECFSKEELDSKEIYYINLYNSTDKQIGYNIQTGGLSNPTTTLNHVWINKNNKDKLIDESLIEYYLLDGWQFGRTHSQQAWNKGKHKESDESLANISKIRKEKIANGEIKCCYGLKGAESPNWKSDSYLIENYINKGFEKIWLEHGKCYTCRYFKIRNTTFDRIMKLAGLEETQEHKNYIYTKNRKRN